MLHFGMISAKIDFEGMGKVTKVLKIKLKKVPKNSLAPREDDITAIKFKGNSYEPQDNQEEDEKKQSIEDAIDEILNSKEYMGT